SSAPRARRPASTASMSSTANARWRMPGAFAGACRLPPWVGGVWNFGQLESSVAVRGLQDRDLCPDPVEPHDAVHPAALDRPLALQLESEFDELGCGREVVNHDADVLHPLDRHVLDGKESKFEPRRAAPKDPTRLHFDYRSSDIHVPRADQFSGGAGRCRS